MHTLVSRDSTSRPFVVCESSFASAADEDTTRKKNTRAERRFAAAKRAANRRLESWTSRQRRWRRSQQPSAAAADGGGGGGGGARTERGQKDEEGDAALADDGQCISMRTAGVDAGVGAAAKTFVTAALAEATATVVVATSPVGAFGTVRRRRARRGEARKRPGTNAAVLREYFLSRRRGGGQF